MNARVVCKYDLLKTVLYDEEVTDQIYWQSFGYNIFSEINSFADNTFQYDRFIQNSTKTNIRKTNLKALFFDTL